MKRNLFRLVAICPALCAQGDKVADMSKRHLAANDNVRQIDDGDVDGDTNFTQNLILLNSTTPSFAPTAQPSPTPSSSPSARPSASPSSSPTLSSAPSSAPIPYSRPPRVDIRYVSWFDLPSDIATTATLLNYTYATWNDYGVHPIENRDWDRLTRAEKMYVGILGYERQSWNCWSNHYQSLRWIDLDNEGIQARQWWEQLGWSIASWNSYEEPPTSNDKYWFSLSEEERFAAAQLCYFKRTWDEADVYVEGFPMDKPTYRYTNWLDLNDDIRIIASDGLSYNEFLWNVVGLNPVEARGWKQLNTAEQTAAKSLEFTPTSWDCWVNHYRSYSWEELQVYGIDLYYSALGWNAQSWIGLEDEPDKKSWEQLTEMEIKAAIELCYSFETWDGYYDMMINYGPFPFATPKRRYVEWVLLPKDIQMVANATLKYTEETWNNLGSAEIETLGWNGLTDEQQSDAIELGFYEETWDCFHTHYKFYSWIELSTSQQDSYRLLGWSEASWLIDEMPSSYEKRWNQLSTTEQSAANTVCYFEYNWDKRNLKEAENAATAGDPMNPTQGLGNSDVFNGRNNSANGFTNISTGFISLAVVACILMM